MPVLQLQGIVRWFAGRRILDGVDLRVHSGEWVGLIGPNGSGKTTVLNLISRLINPDAGQILLSGTDITRFAPERLAGMGVARIFQTAYVGGHLSVMENVRLGQRTSQQRADDERAAIDALNIVGLPPERFAMPSKPDRLSMRLLEIARVIVSRPQIVLLDEPAAGLGPMGRVDLGVAIEALRTLGTAVILVEHDERFVRERCTRVLTINDGKFEPASETSSPMATPIHA